MPDVLEPPVAPAAPSTLSPTPSSPTMDAFDQTFSDLEPSTPTPQIQNAPVPETTRPVPSKDPATGKFTKQDKPDDSKTGEPTDKPPVQDGQVDRKSDDGKLGEVPKVTEFTPPQVVKPSELKQWAKRMGTRAEQAEQQLAQVNRKLKEIESRPQTSVDVQAVTAELAATKKRLEEHESQLRVTKYERSEHYRDNYEKPYQEVVSKAYRKVAQLVVTEPKPNGQVDENGKPTEFNERQATPQDLDAVYYAGNPMLQRRVAKQLFGEDFQTALNLCEGIQEKKESAIKAIEDNKIKATEYEQQQTAQKQLEQEGRSTMFNAAKGAIYQKFTDFGKRDGDAQWNQGLAKGTYMADLAFSDRQGLTPEQSAILDAQVHARISWFPGLKAERDAFKAERDALKKELEDIRASGPGKPAAGSVKSEAKHLTLDQAFDEAVPE